MDISKIINRGINVILKPKQIFNEIKTEQTTLQNLIIYLAVFALPGLIGYIIGYGVVGITYSYRFAYLSYKVGIGHAVGFGIFYYIMTIIGVIAFGYVVNFLAPNFKSKQNLIQAMKLVVFTATPALLAGIFNIFPPLGLLVILGAIYSLYLLYIGIPVLMETPNDQHIIYLIISIVVYIVIVFIISWITSSLMWAALGGYPGSVTILPPY